MRTGLLGQHASNLGGLIAQDIAATLPNARAYIVDPVVVDELQPVARLSGHPEIREDFNLSCAEPESCGKNLCIFSE